MINRRATRAQMRSVFTNFLLILPGSGKEVAFRPVINDQTGIIIPQPAQKVNLHPTKFDTPIDGYLIWAS